MLPSPQLMKRPGYFRVRRQQKINRSDVYLQQVVGEYANRYDVLISGEGFLIGNRAEGRKVMREMRPEDEVAIRRVQAQIKTLGEQLQAMKDEAFRNGRTIPMADLEALVVDRNATN